MKSLKDHNEERRSTYLQGNSQKGCPNDIACPKCLAELWDTNPHVTTLSIPPQKDVYCPECGYTGYRLA